MNREKVFEYLRRKSDDKPFDWSVVKNWYIAREYVLRHSRHKDIAFAHDSLDHLHIVIHDDSPRMLFVARQMALSSHYINFDEEMGKKACRTLMTIVSQNPDIKQELAREEYLCNLPHYCNYTDNSSGDFNWGPYVDIEIEIVRNMGEVAEKTNEITLHVDKSEVDAFFDACENSPKDADIFWIDTRKAVFASRIYDLGGEIHNLPAENIHCAQRYSMALDIFRHVMLRRLSDMVAEQPWSTMGLCRLKEKISNVYCSDCFPIRAAGVRLSMKKTNMSEAEAWRQLNEPLSRSEHARWVTERLIQGYRPFNKEERYHHENLYAQAGSEEKRKQYKDYLKRRDTDPAHIDLCSYSDLRRIDPDSMKYDTFLMLAIPMILKKIGDND